MIALSVDRDNSLEPFYPSSTPWFVALALSKLHWRWGVTLVENEEYNDADA
jgi:hypothetical protein